MSVKSVKSDNDDEHMRDAEAVEEEEAQYGRGVLVEEDLDEKYPNRPHNHGKTLPFHEIYLTLLNPLNENKKKPTGPIQARRKVGPHGSAHLSVRYRREQIIDTFIGRWRKEVGNDIYPAFRLIVPEKDRDRAMYGLKEKTIGKLLVRVMKIDKNSSDAYNLLNWKLPGVSSTSAMAGDFAGRCYEVISKRPIKTTPGSLTIGQVNEMLDRLSAAQKEENQLPIFEKFYENMNAEEMLWLIRIILRQMKIGASEKTLFKRWHKDADALFNVSSSLRRVCWELYDPTIDLAGDDRSINLMQCFQPQLAAFQMRSMEKIVQCMHLSDENPVFWIEEKLDGERMQLHMVEDENTPGGFRFGFWSRKGKDYTYLYGSGFEEEKSALSKFIKGAFNPGVRNIVLDGEMIHWDVENDIPKDFGRLKSAALAQQWNEFHHEGQPLFKVFDCLYLNDQVLTSYTLRDRRKALEQSIKNKHRRIEVHDHVEARTAQDIDNRLQMVVAAASEGLVVKNPESTYRLNERNEDWIKVKPEYMTEFGESLDCVVIGGYYGSGHRGGGNLSSFLCGLRLDDAVIANTGCNPMKTYSFFKVGGGFSAADYAEIRHRTDGKWLDWDRKKPPMDWIELGGGEKQCERPDVWIKPCDSVVLEVKAAAVTKSEEFRMDKTLRFPRFKRLRTDKSWKEALSVSGFNQLKDNAERERRDKQFKIDDARRQRRAVKTRKRPLTAMGADDAATTPYAGPQLKVFEGLTIYIITGAPKPINKSKAELEQLVKANGGKITQTHKDPNTICIAEGNQIRVASIKKDGSRNIVRPVWLLDCIAQAEADLGRMGFVLPYEPRHVLFATAADQHSFEHNIDLYGDSFARDATVDELEALINGMPKQEDEDYDVRELMDGFLGGKSVADLPGWLFRDLHVFFAGGLIHANDDMDVDGAATALPSQTQLDINAVKRMVLFGGGSIAEGFEDDRCTHVVVSKEQTNMARLRQKLSRYG